MGRNLWYGQDGRERGRGSMRRIVWQRKDDKRGRQGIRKCNKQKMTGLSWQGDVEGA